MEFVVVIIALLLCFPLWVFIRALSVRMMTGKWPHQDQRSKDIFDGLP